MCATSGPRVLALNKGHRTAVLHYAGAIEILYPEFEPPAGTYFWPALTSAAEIQHEVARIKAADMVMLENVFTSSSCGSFPQTPETERALAEFKQIEQSKYFLIYERR